MKKYIFLVAVILVACSEEEAVRYSVAPELVEYVDAFYNGKSLSKDNLIVELKPVIQATTVTGRELNGQLYLYFHEGIFNRLNQEGNQAKIEAIISNELGKMLK